MVGMGSLSSVGFLTFVALAKKVAKEDADL
jgi:hypothetical protein